MKNMLNNQLIEKDNNIKILEDKIKDYEQKEKLRSLPQNNNDDENNEKDLQINELEEKIKEYENEINNFNCNASKNKKQKGK